MFLLFCIPLCIFGFYGLVILYYNKKDPYNCEKLENIKFYPSVSIVIPTHNEESFISKKIENLLNTTYPKDKLEIIFVDDSKDSTPSILQKYVKKFSFIDFIHFKKRKGYTQSMIIGSKAAKGEIILLSDAHSFFDKNTISNIIKHFKNPIIGAVTGKNIIINKNEEIGKSENLYSKLINLLRNAETNIYSTFWFKGEASAVRKKILTDLKVSNVIFDVAIALHVIKKGYKTIYDSKCRFYEYAPKTHSERIKQKTIRAANLINTLLNYKNMFFNSKYSKFGLVIFPINFLMLTITPISIFIGFILLTILSLVNYAFTRIILLFIFIIIISMTILSRSFLFIFLEYSYSLLKAQYQIIFTKIEHDKISKIESTRRG